MSTTTTVNPNAVSEPKHCSTCYSTHAECVCGWCHSGPPPEAPYCWSCDHHHTAGESHCPNCGQPASTGFHATWNLDDCPIWIDARGWVPIAETTAEERAATWPDGAWTVPPAS